MTISRKYIVLKTGSTYKIIKIKFGYNYKFTKTHTQNDVSM